MIYSELETPSDKVYPGEARPSIPGVEIFAGIKFVRIPPGKFLMGSRDDNPLALETEKPQHTVEIPKTYWLGRFPVTNEQYAIYLEGSGNKHDWVKDWKKRLDHPVENISWKDAMAFCDWLNNIFGEELPSGYAFRLPTEAEWEKAARGEFGFEWPWGNEFDANNRISSEGGKDGTTPVGAYSRQGDSPFGCADLVGNVWEWTHSLWKPYRYEANDGREDPKSVDNRVLRGGSFLSYRRLARCAYRDGFRPGDRDGYLGFRVGVLSPI